MRADRLLTILMLLQARGRMTAVTLAQECEVSERTIYRDINALSAAGVPVYGEPGRDGGYGLLDSYRTRLTGLTEGEVRALFMLSIPKTLTQLGVGKDLKAAMLKLSAALPASRREDEEKVRQRFHLDSTPWFLNEESVPHLPIVHQAVWETRKLYLSYRLPYHAIEVDHLVKPYGLVAKAGHWHLVYGRDGIRVHRVADFLDVRHTDETFERPSDFDLAAFWQAYCAQRENRQLQYLVSVRVAPNFAPYLPHYFGDQIREQIDEPGSGDKGGATILTLHFESLEAAREQLLGLGRAIEVLEPRALRVSIRDYAAQIVTLYDR